MFQCAVARVQGTPLSVTNIQPSGTCQEEAGSMKGELNETLISLSSGSYRKHRGTESGRAETSRQPPMEPTHSPVGCNFHPILQRRELRLSRPSQLGSQQN